MKLATLKSAEERDGILCMINHDHTKYIEVQDIVKNLQTALDCWAHFHPLLEKCYHDLNEGKKDKDTKTFEASKMASPLPRAYQWLDASAYLNHVKLVREARGAPLPDNVFTDPLMYQGGSDTFLSPMDPIYSNDEKDGIDFEAEIAIVTDDVPMGIDVASAAKHIKLILLVNDVSLRNLIPPELSKGFGFLQSKPSSSFAPIALTPDELGKNWDGARAHLTVQSILNGRIVGIPNAGFEMHFSFPQLIAHAAKTRRLIAGTIIGSGTVSNKDKAVGYSCIAEQRMREIIEQGQPQTPFMRFGDQIRIEALDNEGNSVFGAIDQCVKHYKWGNS